MKSKLTFLEYIKANLNLENLIKFLIFHFFTLGLFLLVWFLGSNDNTKIADSFTIIGFTDLGIMLIIGIIKLGFMSNIVRKMKENKKINDENFRKKYNAPTEEELLLISKNQKNKKEKYKSNFIYFVLLLESIILVCVALILSYI
ncbi:hypothetical protein [Mycoplasma elephantis]|uniref:hypothetical protein n=1 Tax=Mycoplasma elephantis TaxID=114882 RepID=UPI000481D3EC|nr:hypothetical protein [Mycoplasma elephantis]